jgi:hypothetical protein
MSASPTLYTLAEDLAELESILDNPEVPPEEKQGFIDQWLKAQGDTLKKVDGYCALIRQKSAEAAMFKNEETFFKDKRTAAENTAQDLKNRLLVFMQWRGQDRMDAGRFKVSVCSAGKAPVIVECDPAELPDELKKITIEPNKTAIGEKLEAGEDVPGCSIGERSRYVRVS